MSESCADCRFFFSNEGLEEPFEVRVCRRHPPEIWGDPMQYTQTARISVFPEMGPKGWCGEYQAKPSEAELNGILDEPLDMKALSVRTRNRLSSMNVRTLRDLAMVTDVELLAQPNLGECSLSEVKAYLASKKLTLGMTFV